MLYRRTGFTANSVTFTKPDDFSDTVKASVERKNKNIGDAKLTHVGGAIKLNRRFRVNPTSEGETCCVVPLFEDLAMTFQVSGSTASIAKLLQMRADLDECLDLWLQDLTNGFLPLEIAPTLPATP